MATFSIIIPTLNEAERIADCIAAVRALDPAVELLVADGGSSDATVERAQQAGAVVINAPRGRGPQCNAGAAAARGEILVFLHADTRLPAEAFTLMRQWFDEPQVAIAKFRLSFDQSNPLLDLAACMMWLDSRLTSYGDQGIVIRRDLFNSIGGFPDWPLFEDVRLFELARTQTRVYVLPAQVVTSSRRFQANGSLAQLIIDLGLWLEYVAGVSPFELAARYERRKGT